MVTSVETMLRIPYQQTEFLLGQKGQVYIPEWDAIAVKYFVYGLYKARDTGRTCH